jgi:FMN phosphatase YigB (HAD superfamily)
MAQHKPVRNLILDFGGVLLNLDYSLTFNKFRELGFTDIEEYFNRNRQTPLFDLLETGKIRPAEFREGIRELSGVQISDEDIDSAWNAMLLDLPMVRMELLELANSRYRTFLLSNTNPIHKEAFMKEIHRVYGKGTFESHFEKLYFSHEMGLRKPGVEIYQHVLEDLGLDPAETIFVDDSLPNLVGAEKAGLRTVHAKLPLEFIKQETGLMENEQ